MKTAELIPLILLELSSGDKYGFELTKSIETKSNGKVVIKQPTLYTVLKKLEKSKFISSYWEDSEIGGKRHYYKLTENGRNQVSTLPPFSVLVANLSNEDDETESQLIENDKDQLSFDTYSTSKPSLEEIEKNEEDFKALEEARQKRIQQEKENANNYVSIMDLLVEDEKTKTTVEDSEKVNENESVETKIEPKESVLPTDEVFSDTNIDNATEMEINQQNTSILKDNNKNKEETFATNDNVSKFTQTNTTMLSDEYKSKLREVKKDNSVDNFLNTKNDYVANVEDEIKYVDYVNLKSDANYVYSKKLTKNMLYRILSSCAYLLVMLVICAIAVSRLNASPLYYIFLIASILFILFSITLFLLNAEKFRLKHKNSPLKIDIKKHIIIATAIFILIFILCVIVSVTSGVENIFALYNFANLYAPLLISTTLYIDILFSYLFLVKHL